MKHFHPVLALRCDAHGMLTEVLSASTLPLAPTVIGRPFPFLVEVTSFARAHEFIRCMCEQHHLTECSLEFRVDGCVIALSCAGDLQHDQMIIVATPSADETAHLLTTLISTVGSYSVTSHPPRTESYFSEVTQLNNELVTMQRELVKQNARLTELHRQKNLFMGIAAHEIRNPLNVILNFTEFLIEDTGRTFTPDQRYFLALIKESTETIIERMHALLDFSTIESGYLHLEKSPTNLMSLVSKVIVTYRQIASHKNISIKFTDDRELILTIDAPKFTQVLDNLLINAIKYSTVDTTITLTIMLTDTNVTIAIQDQGPGIPAEKLQQIFSPFERLNATARRDRSAGLGLAVAHRIVTEHGGQLTVESDGRTGSMFIITLPRE